MALLIHLQAVIAAPNASVSGLSCGLLVALLTGCITVDDQREEEPELPPSGQVDTGFIPDTGGPDLPPRTPCGTDLECIDWLGDTACQIARCIDDLCVADPLEDGLPCSDGDFATRGDQCRQGACDPGPAVCVCEQDEQCGAFDDGKPCNGRLRCDGCSCLPMETPPGTPCDDLSPATVGDVCIDADTCAGQIPCQCEAPSDCGETICLQYACAQCQCVVYPDLAGQLYLSETFDQGLQPGWTTTTDNPAVSWRTDTTGGLRASGSDGTYNHGAATVVLESPPLTLPAGIAVLRADIGLFSAESGCDDRLELYIGGVLLDSLCGASAVETRTWALPEQTLADARLRLVFVSDDDQNAAAGPFLDNVLWIRANPTPQTCTKTPDIANESVVPQLPAGDQRRPAIGRDGEGFRVFWEADDGVHSRSVDGDGAPLGPELTLDGEGVEPDAAGDFAAWSRPESLVVVVYSAGENALRSTTGTPDGVSVAADGGGVAWREQTPEGPIAMLRVDPLLEGDAIPLGGADEALLAPRIAAGDDGLHVVVSRSLGVARLDGSVAQPLVLAETPATSRPDIAAGLGRVVSVWTTENDVQIHNGSVVLTVPATQPLAPAVAATSTNWFVVWTEAGGADAGLSGALLTGTAEQVTPIIKLLGTYTFADQDQIRLEPAGADVVATWHSGWIDGDASGVVARRLPTGLSF
ncbi:MAG: hypothetical protein ACI9WU_004297 [Myxococcota bacterium]|jgi:hypothetical protein